MDSVPEDIRRQIVEQVESIYRWIQERLGQLRGDCSGCGECCDFASYDHRLFVTSPEMIYFLDKSPGGVVQQMTGGMCPYNLAGKCSVHGHRFAGCRIFFCKGEITDTQQGQLSEEAVTRFKVLCERYNIRYSYLDLKAALNSAAL